MDFRISASSRQYLADLTATQLRQQKAQAQIGSGLRLTAPSDDPSAIDDIYRLQARLVMNQRTQDNLQQSQTALSTADTALQSSIDVVESAISLSSQGISSNLNTQDMAVMAVQAAGLQQTVVGLSQALINGKYIFSGDQPDQPQYQYDTTQPTGVLQISTGTASQVTNDINGSPIAVAKSAQEIFDARDAAGAPTTGNVFAALNDLRLALQAGDRNLVIQANGSLKQALDYLNQQLVFYGQAEQRVTEATDLAKKFQLSEQNSLGNIQDTDVPAAALVLSQSQTQQQATLAVEAKMQQLPTLFSFLG